MRTTKMAISKKRRILVVDDEVDVTLTLKLCLEENGFIADTYDNSACAIKNFKAGVYDLLMVDIKMPGMNGFELYKEVKKKDNEVKVCFLTAGDTYYASYADIFNTLGIECFIQKPIENEELIGRIKNMLVST
jgi:two-component system, OmpR family, response regulator ChvI